MEYNSYIAIHTRNRNLMIMHGKSMIRYRSIMAGNIYNREIIIINSGGTQANVTNKYRFTQF